MTADVNSETLTGSLHDKGESITIREESSSRHGNVDVKCFNGSIEPGVRSDNVVPMKRRGVTIEKSGLNDAGIKLVQVEKGGAIGQ